MLSQHIAAADQRYGYDQHAPAVAREETVVLQVLHVDVYREIEIDRWMNRSIKGTSGAVNRDRDRDR